MAKDKIILPPLETPPQAAESLIPSETQEQVKDLIAEKIVIQPIVQPIQVQSDEQLKPQFQTFTADPQFEEVATYAETWTWQNIAQPIIARGVKVYNDNIPENEIRPREYVVMSVDDQVQDINFADNRNQNEESLVTLIIQGFGNTFDNWVVEISNFIHELLRGFREQGKVHSIVNRNIGIDETTQTLSRTINFWLVYE